MLKLVWLKILHLNIKKWERFWILLLLNFEILFRYHKIASSNTSCLEAHVGFFRLLMKGIFGPYVLWPFEKKLFFYIVTALELPTIRYAYEMFWIHNFGPKLLGASFIPTPTTIFWFWICLLNSILHKYLIFTANI